jgi:hypothetical protein
MRFVLVSQLQTHSTGCKSSKHHNSRVIVNSTRSLTLYTAILSQSPPLRNEQCHLSCNNVRRHLESQGLKFHLGNIRRPRRMRMPHARTRARTRPRSRTPYHDGFSPGHRLWRADSLRLAVSRLPSSSNSSINSSLV